VTVGTVGIQTGGLTTTFAGGFTKGLALDGFLSGAVVYVDANRNGMPDFLDANANGEQDEDEPFEPATTTRADGSFLLLIPIEFDRDGEGLAEPQDVLIGINHIHAVGGSLLPPVRPAGPEDPVRFYDVNPDCHVTPQDILTAINFLNSQSAHGGGKAEATTAAAGGSISDDDALFVAANLAPGAVTNEAMPPRAAEFFSAGKRPLWQFTQRSPRSGRQPTTSATSLVPAGTPLGPTRPPRATWICSCWNLSYPNSPRTCSANGTAHDAR